MWIPGFIKSLRQFKLKQKRAKISFLSPIHIKREDQQKLVFFFCRRSPDGDEPSESSVTLAGSLFRRYRSLRVCQGQPKEKEHQKVFFLIISRVVDKLDII